MKYTVIIEKGPTSYGAYLPDLPGCVAAGDTRDEVISLITEAVADHLEVMFEHGETVPGPTSSAIEVEVPAPGVAEEAVIVGHTTQLPASWISLTDFHTKLGASPPLAARFSGSQDQPIVLWKDFLVGVADWLVRRGVLTPGKCPVMLGTSRYMVHSEPVHSNGADFKSPRQLSNGLFLETHQSAVNIVDRTRRLIELLGEDPSGVYLKVV